MSDSLMFSSISRVYNMKLVSIFTLIFINSTVLVICENLSITVFDYYSSGKSTDFDDFWYLTVSVIFIETQLINLICIPVYSILEYLVFQAYYWYDRHFQWSKSNAKTRQPTIIAYLKYYTGPRFGMEFQRATLLTVTAIGVVFGPVFPLLYPLICVLILTTYFIEKVSACWWYPETASFDEKMAKSCA